MNEEIKPIGAKRKCEEIGFAHSWETGPVYLTNPPIPTRVCVNCGKKESYSPGEWN